MKGKIMLILLIMLFQISNVIGQTNPAQVSVTFLNQIPDPVPAGQIVELRFKIENYGGLDAQNVKFQLITKYPFLPVEGEKYLQTVNVSRGQNSDNAIVLKYSVKVDKDSSKGAQKIELSEIKGDSSAVLHSATVDVSGKDVAQIIYVDKAKIDPGKETALSFTIFNSGSSALRNMIFSWSESTGKILPVYSDDTRYIKYLDVDQSVTLNYSVIADINAQPGLYPLSLNLKFEGANSSDEINTKAGIFIGGQTDFDVTYSESTVGQTSLSVANIGNNPAMSVTVRVPEQESVQVTGSRSSIVGNLDKGDYTIVSFQMASGSNSTRANPRAGPTQMPNRNLKVLVDYTDTTGERHSIEKSVPVQFRSGSEVAMAGPRRFSLNSLIVPALVIVAIAAGLFYFFRMRKSKRKN